MWQKVERAVALLAKVSIDAAVVCAAYAIALVLRFDGDVPGQSWSAYVVFAPAIAAGYVIANAAFGVYRAVWRYGGIRDVFRLGTAVSLVTVAVFLINLSFERRDLPLGSNLIAGAFILLGMTGVRLWPSLVKGQLLPSLKGQTDATNVLIIGAGDTGQLLAREFLNYPHWRHRPVCFVDDDRRKRGMRIHGVPVAGDRYTIPHLVQKYAVNFIALAIPSLGGASFEEMLALCQQSGVSVRVVPSIGDMVSGNGRFSPAELREMTVDDLLSREPVALDQEECSRLVKGKVVLITGAAGSIGSQLARRLATFQPAELHLLDTNETGLYDLRLDLSQKHQECAVRLSLGNIADRDKVFRLFRAVRPHLVFHTAAYKHIAVMEEHPDEGFRVNVLGTLAVCQAAQDSGAEKVLFISSSKAAGPSTLMGATKRIGERIVAALSQDGGTAFYAVRLPNVIDSRGGVFSIFWHQIERGGRVSVTHPEMARHFLSVNEVSSLLIQAMAQAQLGQLFMLKVGGELRIVELAERMIRFKGLSPKEVEIVYTGLRPGEKVHEELLDEGERTATTAHDQILFIQGKDETHPSVDELMAEIAVVEDKLGSESPQELAARIYALASRDKMSPRQRQTAR